MPQKFYVSAGLIVSAIAVLLAAAPVHAQPWEATSIPPTSRFNDVYFTTPDSGWAVSGTAQIYRTTNGGETWSLQFSQPESHLRSVGFLNGSRGFAGNVGEGEFGTTDRVALYETSDGGVNWSPMDIFHGPAPKGLCGMYVVNDSTVVAVGRVRGPAFFARTTDAGETWHTTNMDEYAAGLIDVYFPHPDTGFAVGLTNVDHVQSSGVVLATTDGGETWEERFVTSRTGEWIWKMSFPTRRTGYASLQRNYSGPIYFLKTSDGGQNWEEKLFTSGYYFVQGIGFVDENTGWIGGNSSSPPYVTTDGGDTWEPTEIGLRLNRFRFLSDTLGYAAGATVHRYSGSSSTAIARPESPVLAIDAIHPNPFAEEAVVVYHLAAPSSVSITVHDLLGRTVRTLANGFQETGQHELVWNGREDGGGAVAPGTYFVVMRIGDAVRTQPVVRIR